MKNPRNLSPAAREPAPPAMLTLTLAAALLGGASVAAAQPPRDPGSPADGADPAACSTGPADGCEPATPSLLRGFYVSVGGGGSYLFNDERLGLDGLGSVGAAVGFSRGPLRLEIEFLARGAEDDAYDDHGTEIGDFRGRGFPKFPGAWAFGEEQAELETGQLFVNFYYDFHNGSRFTPWIGAGGGWATAEAEYAAVSGAWLPGSSDTPGRSGRGRREFPPAGGFGAPAFRVSDTVPGMQLLAGLDIALGNRFSIEARTRWSHFGQVRGDGAYEDHGETWISSRNPVEGGPFSGRAFPVSAPPLDLSSVGATLSVRYRF